jgi:hypothetical protein
MAPSSHFYESLPISEQISDLFDISCHSPLPDDWHIVMVDVQALDSVIAQGRYRDVHTITAAAAVAAINAAQRKPLPFFMRAGGLRIAVPREYVWEVSRALVGLKQLVGRRFGLSIVIGYVAMSVVREFGHELRVSRLRVSRGVVQACFLGSGILHAEHLLRVHHPAVTFPDNSRERIEVNLKGLECRWRPLRSDKEESVCLVVQPRASDPQLMMQVLNQVRSSIEQIYGKSSDRNPIRRDELILSLGRRILIREAKLRARGHGRISFEAYLLFLRATVALGRVLMRLGVTAGGVCWAEYKDMLIKNADVFRLVQGVRCVLAGSKAHRAELTRFLESLHRKGEIYFGMHATRTLHMTCMVFSYADEHLHCLDGADGGFFFAEKSLQEQVDAG